MQTQQLFGRTGAQSRGTWRLRAALRDGERQQSQAAFCRGISGLCAHGRLGADDLLEQPRQQQCAALYVDP